MTAPKTPVSPLKRIGVKAPLPEVGTISLEGLEAKLDAPRSPSSDELLEDLRELQYRTAVRIPRSLGELVGPEDEVNVDTIGYCEGALVPFSVNEGLMLGPHHDMGMPGLFEATQGKAVGSTIIAHLVVPPKHPVPHLRGKPVVFTVRINGASLLFAGDVESPEFLADAKLGDSLEAVMESLAQARIDADVLRAREKALQQVLETLAVRAQVQVSPQLVDAEIGRRWRSEEGALLGRLQMKVSEQEAALSAWLENPELRQDAERQLRAALVLRAVALQENLTDAQGLRQTMDTLLEGLGADANRVREAFKKANDAATNAKALDSLIYLRASEFVWSKVKVTSAAA